MASANEGDAEACGHGGPGPFGHLVDRCLQNFWTGTPWNKVIVGMALRRLGYVSATLIALSGSSCPNER